MKKASLVTGNNETGRFQIDATRLVVVGLFVLLAAGVFLLQYDPVLFGDGHLGWVSSHTLSIIRNATPERLFLGFSCEFADDRGASYFDRYPVVFSGLMNTLLKPFEDDFDAYVAWARFYMNVIYVLCMLVGYRIALLLTGDRLVSLLATMFTFMGVFFVYYKEMIHFDQPAILGLMLLFLAICRYELKGESKWLWVAALAVLLGRGYVSTFLLLLWNLIHVVPMLLNRRFNIARYLKSTPFLVFILGGALSTAALTSNVISEARIKEVPWYETSIIKSAKWRLTSPLRAERSDKTAIVPFAVTQAERTAAGFAPYALLPYGGNGESGVNLYAASIFVLLVLVLAVYSLTRTDLTRRARRLWPVVTLGLLAGFFWLFTLRSLAAFHNYTAMYNALFYLVSFCAVFYALRRSRLAYAAVSLGAVLFLSSLVQLHETRAAYNKPGNAISGDVDRIRQYFRKARVESVFFPEGYRELVEGSPYAACLYFGGFRIADSLAEADAIVTRMKLNEPELVEETVRLRVYSVP